MAKITSLFIYALLSFLGQSAPVQVEKVIQTKIIHSTPQTNGLGNAGIFAPFVSMGVGQPPQNVSVLLDTGSSDLLIAQTGSKVCKIKLQECTGNGFVTGSFDPSQSANVQSVNASFNASFADGVTMTGSYITAPITLSGNMSIPNNQIALYNDVFLPPGEVPFPVFGVGPVPAEAAKNVYPNVPAHLADIGAINSNMFSIYMNDFRSPTGDLTFGGVDTAKFKGKLEPTPIIPDNNGINSDFIVQFSSMKLINQNSSEESSNVDLTPKQGFPPSVIDTGNPAINVPVSSVKALAKALNTNFDEETGSLGSVPCDIGADGQSLMFGLNKDKAQISVPLDMLVFPDPTGETQDCFLPIGGFLPNDGGSGISSLGAPFMQSAYIVFDVDKGSLFMAQAIINATASNVQPWRKYQSMN